MVTLTQNANEDLRAFLVIGAFAGLRHAEILRLDCSRVDLACGFIQSAWVAK
jgi:integrase